MNKAASTPMIGAAIAIVCIGLAIWGFTALSGPKAGEKPKLNPVLNRMYGPHPDTTGSQTPTNKPDRGN